MKKLLNTLYVTREKSYLKLEGENVVVSVEEAEVGRYPLHALEGICAFNYAGASPALMGACAERGVDLCFFTPSNRFLARVAGETHGSVLLRRTQARWTEDPERSLAAARGMIAAKLYNARWVVERAIRDHPQRVDVEKLRAVSGRLVRVRESAVACETLELLRGEEAVAAAAYFSVFDDMILGDKPDFAFRGRSRRPPLDRVNALLSFCYSLLARECAAALEGVGLDPRMGFMHADRAGRASLALDLMEELRAPFADRFVLSLINRRMVEKRQFRTVEGGAVRMEDDARRALLAAWQQRKQETIVHPYLGEKIAWGMVPHAQTLLLSRWMRGDLEAYPPFFWK